VRRQHLPPVPAGWIVVAGNALWVAGSVWLALGERIAPNRFGVAFLLAQAAVVALLAALEGAALRRNGDSKQRAHVPAR